MEKTNQISELVHKGRWEEISRALIEENTSIKTSNPSKLFLEPIVELIKIDKKNEALKMIGVCLTIYQNSSTLHNLEGLVHQLKKSPGLAEKAYKKAINLKPEYAMAWNNLGTIYRELDMLSDALICFKRAAKHDTKYIDALWNLADCLFSAGEFDDSILICNKLLTSERKSNAYYLLGLMSRDRKNLDASMNFFKKAIKSSPIRYYEAEFELASVLANTNQFSAALSTFSSITECPTFGPKAHANIGLVLSRVGKLAESLEHFEKALSKGEEGEEVFNGYAVNLNDSGDHDRANRVFQKALVKYPNSFTTNFNYGVHLHNRKMYKESQEFIVKSLEINSAEIGLRKIAYGYMLKNEYELKNYLKLKSELDNIQPTYLSAMSGYIAAKTKEKFSKEVTNAYCANPLSYFRHQSLLNDKCFKPEIFENIRALLVSNAFDIKNQTLLHNGIQTAGNLLSYENTDILNISDLISRKLEEYKSEFQSSTDGFLKYWPQKYMIHAWLLSISSGGKLDPHIHENSWVSGSIYISIPKLESDDGAIVVCESDEESSSYTRRITTLKTYDMCIFPASLCHHTLPFSSDEPRITLAFDVIPV